MSLSGTELLFLGALALLFLGPEGMLDTFRTLGRLSRTLTRAWEDLDEAVHSETAPPPIPPARAESAPAKDAK